MNDYDYKENSNALVEIEDMEAFAESKPGEMNSGAILIHAWVRRELKEIWIPKQFIDDRSEVYKRDTKGTLVIPHWLAKDKELI